MPRPKLTKVDVREAERMKRAGCYDKDIAAYIGVRVDTFSKWINSPKSDNQRQLAQVLKKAEAERKRDLLTLIFNAAASKADPKWQAAAWLLERQYPDEFGQRQRVQAEARVEAAPAFYFDPREADEAQG